MLTGAGKQRGTSQAAPRFALSRLGGGGHVSLDSNVRPVGVSRRHGRARSTRTAARTFPLPSAKTGFLTTVE